MTFVWKVRMVLHSEMSVERLYESSLASFCCDPSFVTTNGSQLATNEVHPPRFQSRHRPACRRSTVSRTRSRGNEAWRAPGSETAWRGNFPGSEALLARTMAATRDRTVSGRLRSAKPRHFVGRSSLLATDRHHCMPAVTLSYVLSVCTWKLQDVLTMQM